MTEVERGGVGNSAKSIGGLLRELAEPIGRDEKIHDIVARAARKSGLTYWRCFNYWYGKARREETDERAQVVAALSRKRTEETRNELHNLKLRLARLEATLAQSDPDFHHETITAHRAIAARGGF